MSRWPLRVQLPAIAIALLVIAELAVGLVATAILQRTLVAQVDSRLEEATGALDKRPQGPAERVTVAERLRLAELPSEYVVFYHDRRGTEVTSISSEVREGGEAPEIEVDLDAQAPYTVRVDGTLQRWRVMSSPLRNGRGTVTVALPLADVTAATAALRRTVLIVAVGSALVGGAIAWAATRRSLQPLREAEATAARIAEGDLTLRVPAGHPGTEAGSLAASLNSMLARLDAAFAAQAKSEEKLRAFLSDASHELRTPLAAIQGYAELERTGAAPSSEQAIERIEANARRMGALVEDLLVLARYDEAASSLTGSERVNLATLAHDAAADLRAQAPDREVTVHIPESQVLVTGSDRHLRQVLANLGGNALRHTPAGTAIEITCESAAGRAVVTVRDHGSGIPPGDRDKVFDRFYRMDASRARETGGSGLGLAIVAAIVAAHGGTISVTDARGGGAAFVVSVPLES